MSETRRDLTTRDLAEGGSAAETNDRAGGDDEPKTASDGMLRDGAEEPTDLEPLLPSEEGERYRSDWESIQATFVDEPRSSVENADELVADLMQRLAASFSEERARLEQQWDSGDDVSTEDLRVTLTKYRTFFERLLTA